MPRTNARAGGYSYVFIVRDVQTGVLYAMKRMVVDAGERLDNAKAEIRVMRSLPRNEHIVQLLASDIVKTQGMYEVRMLMEYCEGMFLLYSALFYYYYLLQYYV